MSQPVIQPVRASVVVDLSPDRAFRLFTDGIGTWWPVESHSMAASAGGVRTETVIFEPHARGRILERMSDGRDAVWGTVLVWDPPHRVVFTWKPNVDPLPATEVEVRFLAEGARTRVELEHRGWERLGVSADRRRDAYESGWPVVFDRYAQAVRSGTSQA